jgi:hypothetical protein
MAKSVSSNAGVAQLVERNLAKVEVESSRLFSRSSASLVMKSSKYRCEMMLVSAIM